MLASFVGYAVSQRLDVWLYHLIWRATERRSGSRTRFLWLRNNAATLLSQVVNTVLFSLIAFAGWYDTSTVVSIMVSSYLVYVATSFLDTPFVYLSRLIKQRNRVPLED